MNHIEKNNKLICLCSKSNFKVYNYHTLNKDFQVLECKNCHLAQTFPPPLDDKEIEIFYEQQEDYHLRGEMLTLWESFTNRLLKIINKYAKGKKLVDVGCNVGIFVKQATKQHYEAIGIDVAQAPLNFGINNLDLKDLLYHGNLKSQNFNSNSIDVITYQQSFEHISNLSNELKEAYRVLKSQGIVVIEVPRFFSTWRFILGNRWYAFSPNQHFWQFGKRGLINLLKREKFQIVAVKTRTNMYHKITFNFQGLIKLMIYSLAWITATGDNLVVIATPNKE